MKLSSLILTLCLVAMLFVAGPLLAVTKFSETKVDGPIVGSGSISKASGDVRAHAVG